MKVVKSIFIFFVIMFVVLIFLEVIPTAPKYPHNNPWIIQEGEKPLIIPNAGAKLLYPEDTIFSFEKIDKDGYDVFEIDLCLTSDNQLISEHDVNIKRLTGQDKLVRDYRYDQLTKYNYAKGFVDLNGETPYSEIDDAEALQHKLVPTLLEELFEKFPDKKYVLELKDTVENSGEDTFKEAVRVLIELIEEYNMENKVIVSSFDDVVTHLIQKESNNTIMTSTATKDSFNFVIYSTLKLDFFYRPNDGALLLPLKDDLSESQVKLIKKVPRFLQKKLTTYNEDEGKYYTNIVKQSIIDDAHRHNMAVQYWTVNDRDNMKKLIKMGVDGIITDRPDILQEVLEEMGY